MEILAWVCLVLVFVLIAVGLILLSQRREIAGKDAIITNQVAENRRLRAEAAKFDRDGDGHIGGSRKRG